MEGSAALSGSGRREAAGRGAFWSAGGMGKGGNQGEGAPEREAPLPTFTWEEIQKHNLRTDKWLVIDRKVYNITRWSSRHPGGHRVIGHYAGEDATVRVGAPPPPFSADGGSREPRCPGAPKPHWPLELGAPRRERKCVSGAHLRLRIFAPRGTEAHLRRGLGVGGPGREGSAAGAAGALEGRAGSPLRTGTHASASSARLAGARDARRGRSGPGALAPQRGRWPPGRCGEEPGGGPGAVRALPPAGLGVGKQSWRARPRPPLPGVWPEASAMAAPERPPESLSPRSVSRDPARPQDPSSPPGPPQPAFLRARAGRAG